MTGLTRVDPDVPRGRLSRVVGQLLKTRLAAWWFCTPVALWLSEHVLWKVDPYLMRWTRGRIGLRMTLPTALLETRGARTGRRRQNAVVYFHEGERVTVIASKLGGPGHPGWYHNVLADPQVRLAGEPFRAEVVDDEATRARLWELADRVFPVYAAYRRRAAGTGRTIPILQLIPSAG